MVVAAWLVSVAAAMAEDWPAVKGAAFAVRQWN
jgi:hypothetical protein